MECELYLKKPIIKKIIEDSIKVEYASECHHKNRFAVLLTFALITKAIIS